MMFRYLMRKNTNMPKKVVLAFSLLVSLERGSIVLTMGAIKFVFNKYVFLNK